MADLKLIIKAVNSRSCGGPGRRALALCTEDGKTLGKQVRCSVENAVGELPTITVSFYVDGDTIRFADNDE